MTEWLFGPAFALWGTPTSWLEELAFGLALAMVGCNIREIHWGWLGPLLVERHGFSLVQAGCRIPGGYA